MTLTEIALGCLVLILSFVIYSVVHDSKDSRKSNLKSKSHKSHKPHKSHKSHKSHNTHKPKHRKQSGSSNSSGSSGSRDSRGSGGLSGSKSSRVLNKSESDGSTWLDVYDHVTETDDQCEHVIWFSRCVGDVYVVSVNGVDVVSGTGPQLGVAHTDKFSSLAIMTPERIEFPMMIQIRVLTGNKLAVGHKYIQAPQEPLP